MGHESFESPCALGVVRYSPSLFILYLYPSSLRKKEIPILAYYTLRCTILFYTYGCMLLYFIDKIQVNFRRIRHNINVSGEVRS